MALTRIEGPSLGDVTSSGIITSTAGNVVLANDYNVAWGDLSTLIRGNASTHLITLRPVTGKDTTIDANGLLTVGGAVKVTTHIGIGATLKGWHASYRALQLYGAGAIMSGAAANESLYIFDNAYYDGAYKYILNGAAGLIQVSSGTLTYSTAAAGSADGTVTFSAKFGVSNAGLLTVSGFGTHTFSADSSGTQELLVENSRTNTMSRSVIRAKGGDGVGSYGALVAEAGGSIGMLQVFPPGYTTSGPYIASGMAVYGGSSGGLSIVAAHTSGAIRFYSGGTTQRMDLSSAGVLTVSGFGDHHFNTASGAGGSNTVHVTNSTATGNANFRLTGGTADGSMQLFGQSYSTGYTYDVASSLNLVNSSAGGVGIVAMSAAGTVRFYAGGTTLRGTVKIDGDLDWVGSILVRGAVPFTTANIVTSTGTAIIIDGSNNWYKQTSSERYKEHFSQFTVSSDVLAAFIALTPKHWDYIGKQDGAVSFTSEQLATLPILNAYGRNPLINYDSEGRPESNRDYGIIALQHLVLQSHDTRLAALEAENATLRHELDLLKAA